MPDFGAVLYLIVALNHEEAQSKFLNRAEAAEVLSEQLKITPGYVLRWFRGDFLKHPITEENFLAFINLYQGKIGLEDNRLLLSFAKIWARHDNPSLTLSKFEHLVPLIEKAFPHPRYSLDDLESYLTICEDFGDEALAGYIVRTMAAKIGIEKTLEGLAAPLPPGPPSIKHNLYRIFHLAYIHLPSDYQKLLRALGGLILREQYSPLELGALWNISQEEVTQQILPYFKNHFGIFNIVSLPNGTIGITKLSSEFHTYTKWLLHSYPEEFAFAKAYEGRLAVLLNYQADFEKGPRYGFLKLLQNTWGRFKESKPPTFHELNNMAPRELIRIRYLDHTWPFLNPNRHYR